MNRPFITQFLSFFVNILISMVCVFILGFVQEWLKGDILAFICWMTPLAIGLLFAGKSILTLFRRRHFVVRLFLIILSAGLLSIGWIVIVIKLTKLDGDLFTLLLSYSIPAIFQLLFLDWRLPSPTDKPKYPQVISGLLSFPITLIISVVFIYAYFFANAYLNRPEKETFLIPEGYKGEVMVIFDQPNGEKAEYEDERRVYRIPSTGVLFTQLKDEYGIIDQEYYYVSANGQRRKIGILDSRVFNEEGTTEKKMEEPPRDSLAIFNAGGTGTMINEHNIMRHYTEFYVGTYEEVKKLEHFDMDYIDSLQNARSSKP